MQPFATKIHRKKAYIDPNTSLNLDTTDLTGGRLSQADNIWVSQGPVKHCRRSSRDKNVFIIAVFVVVITIITCTVTTLIFSVALMA